MASFKKLRRRDDFTEEFQPPEKKLTSEGDILIKDLAKKQARTDITLKDALSLEKEFERAPKFQPITSELAGTSSLSTFLILNERQDRLDKLSCLDLTAEDISLLDDWNKGENYAFNKRKNVNQDVLKTRVIELLKHIDSAENSKKLSENAKTKAKDRIESALTVKPDSKETKLLKFALENKTEVEKLPHPLDDIKEIEKQLISTCETVNINQIRRKARKLNNRIKNEEVKSFLDYRGSSKWDIEKAEPEKPKEKKEYSCKPLNYYTIKDGQIVRLKQSEIEGKSLGNLPKRKLSLDEIKMLPKFKNYELGFKTKKLYLKNLPTNFSENDLKTICEDLGLENIESIQIMYGKMKGQAFLHFSDEESATVALEELNGLIIKEKPMIVSYGKMPNNAGR